MNLNKFIIMTTGNQKTIVVTTYEELYDLYYAKGELGVIEQRMDDNIPKESRASGKSDEVLIRELLDKDTDNLYHVIKVGRRYYITLLGLVIQKHFDSQTLNPSGFYYELLYGEDGRFESWWSETDPTNDASHPSADVYNPNNY